MLRKTYADNDTWEYQYDGRAPFLEILDWCRDNFGRKNVWHNFEIIWISGNDAAALFIVRWS